MPPGSVGVNICVEMGDRTAGRCWGHQVSGALPVVKAGVTTDIPSRCFTWEPLIGFSLFPPSIF